MSASGDGSGVKSVDVSFPLDVYDLTTIKKAAYRLLDTNAVDIRTSKTSIECRVLFDKAISEAEAHLVNQRLRKAVLDQDLRSIAAAETEPMRNAILGFAFSGTPLIGGK